MWLGVFDVPNKETSRFDLQTLPKAREVQQRFSVHNNRTNIIKGLTLAFLDLKLQNNDCLMPMRLSEKTLIYDRMKTRYDLKENDKIRLFNPQRKADC